MKTIKIIPFLLLLCLCTSVNAQLRVLSNGRVQTGLLKENDDIGNVTTLQVFGQYGDMRSGSKLTFGDFGRYEHQGWNVFIGEYGSADTDQLWLHGKSGIYLTTNGYANNVVAYYNPSSNSNFIFNTNLRVNGVSVTSDARLKENVRSLQNSLDILGRLNGVSYNYSLSEIQKNREQDESKFSAKLSAEATGMAQDMQWETDAASSLKASKDEQAQREIERKEAEDASRKRIGFLAQDIQKVLPELVQTDDKGVMSIDYIGFIPIIVESIKEMQQVISVQNEQIEKLLAFLPAETISQFRSATSTENVTGMDARLYNREGASVSYSLPAAYTTASLQIFDITGRFVKKINLDNSTNIVEINRSEVGYGTFVYALFVDGRKTDTLKKYISM